MKMKLVGAKIPVWGEMDQSSSPLVEYSTGAEVDLVKTVTNGGQQWVEIKMPGGQKGYVLGDTKIVKADQWPVGIPLQDQVPPIRFPSKCVYCGAPKQDQVNKSYELSTKVADSDETITSKLDCAVPYCAEHAREAKRNRLVWIVIMITRFAVGVPAFILGILFVNEHGIFGFKTGIMTLVFAVLLGIACALIALKVVKVLVTQLVFRGLKSLSHTEEGHLLGFSLKHYAQDDILCMMFRNEAYAKDFKHFNTSGQE